MMNRYSLSIWLLAFMPFAMAHADDGPLANVAISVQQEGDLWRGQQVTLNLDLKTTGFSFSNTHFNLPEVSGAFLMQTDTTTIKLSETIDGVDWQIIRYPLALYPQKAGQIEVPSIDVRFSSSTGFGSDIKSFEFKTTPLQVPISSPPGVNQQDLVVTTPEFELEHSWQPQTGTAKTGDAITLTVTRRASDISAMLLPPLPVFKADGLAAYSQPPEVSDKTNRGDLVGERVDSIIWVVEQPGSYKIPGIRFQWWDPDNRELRQQVIPGMDLKILPPATDKPQSNAVDDSQAADTGLRWLLVLVILAISSLFLWRKFAPGAKQQTIESEKSTFKALRTACENNDVRQAYAALHHWLNWVSSAKTLSEFAQTCDDPQLSAGLEQLQLALISPQNSWQGHSLLEALKRCRNTIGHQQTAQSGVYLAPLNP